ncbi:TIGR04283 family arsenosugar biosynthesis glycosyltransferase [Beggiatoa leptomitoformis]|uniref:Glycosyltransferase n=1 Tax=Beggiatoa leptomitoformis TaxID=288004 RepID=A0A2N9YCI8_9GAMM|nr:TIGR04283 family arsenosugar biosynthesis glycosyltransferase [Beggiatoa leptomitoformis]ALG66518.1 glycosyltransferase [Beggiatoa leptomitoformis]AUI68185.1 glycosyltransferase [Beggiatoa leptomitoformis]
MSKLSIIIPTLNEQACIVATLQPLQSLRVAGHEIILVDGDSQDDTRKLAAPFVDTLLITKRGRAYQMNFGAHFAHHDILVFLHADTQLPNMADRLILQGLIQKRRLWGRFNVRLSGRGFLLWVIAWLMNWRSCLTGIATGDQAIFVYKTVFQQVNGFPEQPLMEDIVLSKRLKNCSSPLCLTAKVITSSRRWEKYGILRTIFLMWYLRVAYRLGKSPQLLKKYYDE